MVPSWAQDGPKIAPRGPPEASGRPQRGPREGPRRPQDGSKSLPRRIQERFYVNLTSKPPNKPPRPPQDAPKTPPGPLPGAPQDPPRTPQGAPRGSEEGPRGPQEGQERQRYKKKGKKEDNTKLLKHFYTCMCNRSRRSSSRCVERANVALRVESRVQNTQTYVIRIDISAHTHNMNMRCSSSLN